MLDEVSSSSVHNRGERWTSSHGHAMHGKRLSQIGAQLVPLETLIKHEYTTRKQILPQMQRRKRSQRITACVPDSPIFGQTVLLMGHMLLADVRSVDGRFIDTDKESIQGIAFCCISNPDMGH
jgi:hypothetical protein